jgi:hypothetical protein
VRATDWREIGELVRPQRKQSPDFGTAPTDLGVGRYVGDAGSRGAAADFRRARRCWWFAHRVHSSLETEDPTRARGGDELCERTAGQVILAVHCSGKFSHVGVRTNL